MCVWWNLSVCAGLSGGVFNAPLPHPLFCPRLCFCPSRSCLISCIHSDSLIVLERAGGAWASLTNTHCSLTCQLSHRSQRLGEVPGGQPLSLLVTRGLSVQTVVINGRLSGCQADEGRQKWVETKFNSAHTLPQAWTVLVWAGWCRCNTVFALAGFHLQFVGQH